MSEPLVHWNGELVPASEASVSVFDAGFLYGDGIYETMRAYSGRTFALERHLRRLARSASAIDLDLPGDDRLTTAIRETLEENDLDSAIIRVTITRGRLERRLDLSTSAGPSVLVAAEPFDRTIDAERREGVRVVYSRYLRTSLNPLAGVKSTNYQVSLFARNEAREANALEVLVPNESGDIVEAAAANVFLVERDRLVTPPLTSGILGGITREIVIEIAREAGRAVEEQTLARDRIERGDELFLTGTTIQVAPVIEIEDRPMGSGRPGPVTRDLLDAYLAAIRDETDAA